MPINTQEGDKHKISWDTELWLQLSWFLSLAKPELIATWYLNTMSKLGWHRPVPLPPDKHTVHYFRHTCMCT